jgi:broad specificity phosphatase PhoE
VSGFDERACRVFLVRHGQTIMNREVRFRGTRDVPLNEDGRVEALTAARSLAEIPLAAVYASPLGRAREVATAIAGAGGVPRVRDLPGLLNLDYGAWEGLTKEECAERDPEEWARYADDPERCVCPDGEAVSAAADRVLDALRTLGERHPGEAVAAVSHGVMLRLAVLRVGGAPASGWQFKVPTGSAIEFLATADDIRLVTPLAAAAEDPLKDPHVGAAAARFLRAG